MLATVRNSFQPQPSAQGMIATVYLHRWPMNVSQEISIVHIWSRSLRREIELNFPSSACVVGKPELIQLAQ
jgi:hypothetical protein